MHSAAINDDYSYDFLEALAMPAICLSDEGVVLDYNEAFQTILNLPSLMSKKNKLFVWDINHSSLKALKNSWPNMPLYNSDFNFVKLPLQKHNARWLLVMEAIVSKVQGAPNISTAQRLMEVVPDPVYRVNFDQEIDLSLSSEEKTNLYRDHARFTQISEIVKQREGILSGESLQGLEGSKVAIYFDNEIHNCMVREFFEKDCLLKNYIIRDRSASGELLWKEFNWSGWTRNNLLMEIWVIERDITKKVNLLEDLNRSRSSYQNFFDSSKDAIVHCQIHPPCDIRLPENQQIEHIQKNLKLIEFNPAFTELFDHASENKNSNMDSFVNDMYSKIIDDLVSNNFALQDSKQSFFDTKGCEKHYISSFNGRVVDNKLLDLWSMQRDVTDVNVYISEVEFQASHDCLTQLPNRKALKEKIHTAISNNKEGDKVILFLMDLDGFKEINDTLGHHYGDNLLQILGSRMATVSDEVGTYVARLGGDEFGLLMSEAKSYEEAINIARLINESTKEPFCLGDGHNANVSISIGMSVYPDYTADPINLMKYADIAMYQSKRQKLGFSFYSGKLE